ncbi:hypothetical protein QA634_33955 [Methylobacterium sp. CB376]|uniref:hypothetical protein n=1 Tax=unclassified Methylobacterium TaxID=2615210 RepID=UPI000152D41A|nr:MULTISPECIES: hypothetical protein [Methylobacterium]WFT80128.1 hypothetical protein QA634_33955 [Methylobacterium nodulans]
MIANRWSLQEAADYIKLVTGASDPMKQLVEALKNADLKSFYDAVGEKNNPQPLHGQEPPYILSNPDYWRFLKIEDAQLGLLSMIRGSIPGFFSFDTSYGIIDYFHGVHVRKSDVTRIWNSATTRSSSLARAAKRNPLPRGPKPVVMARVMEEMRKIDSNSLLKMKETEMEANFRASRDTCRRARAFV